MCNSHKKTDSTILDLGHWLFTIISFQLVHFLSVMDAHNYLAAHSLFYLFLIAIQQNSSNFCWTFRRKIFIVVIWCNSTHILYVYGNKKRRGRGIKLMFTFKWNYERHQRRLLHKFYTKQLFFIIVTAKHVDHEGSRDFVYFKESFVGFSKGLCWF